MDNEKECLVRLGEVQKAYSEKRGRGEDTGRYGNAPFALTKAESDYVFGSAPLARVKIIDATPEKYKDSTVYNWLASSPEHKKIKKTIIESMRFNFVIMTGPSRRGKSHLLYGLQKYYTDYKFIYFKWAYLESLFSSHRTADEYGREKSPYNHIIEKCSGYDIIQIDDYNPQQNRDGSRHILKCLFELFDYAAAHKKRLMLVSNEKRDSIIASFGYFSDKIEKRIHDGKGVWIDFGTISEYTPPPTVRKMHV